MACGPNEELANITDLKQSLLHRENSLRLQGLSDYLVEKVRDSKSKKVNIEVSS